MNRIRLAPALWCLSAAALLTSTAALAEVTANADVTSNYIFRGDTLSADHVALQGGLDFVHESGLYAGTWLSQVDNRAVSATEYDVYAGYTAELGPITGDLEYLTYNYTDKKFLPNGHEVKVGLKYDWATLNYYLGDTGDKKDNTYRYVELGAKFEPVETVEIALHYGAMSGDAAKIAGEEWRDETLTDYSASISKELSGFKLTAAYAEREHLKPKPYVMLYKEFSF